MTTTTLTTWASTYGVGRRHVDFSVRSSTPTTGAMNDRDAQGQWRVVRGGTIIHRENKILDFQWLGLDGDIVYARAVDSAGNAGDWESYTYVVTANTAADWVRYVDTGGNDTTGTGLIDAPWATVTKAVTEAQAALTSGQVGVIFLSDDQTWAHTANLYSGGDVTSRLVRFVRRGNGTARPKLTFSANINAFTAGKRGVFHVDGVDIEGSASTSGYAFNLARNGGVAADQDAWNFMAVDSNVSGFLYHLFVHNATVSGPGAADRAEDCFKFVALQNVSCSATRSFYIYGCFYVDQFLIADCTFAAHTGAAPNEFTRVWGIGRSFIRDNTFTITAASSTTRWLVQGAGGSDDYSMREVTFARCTWIGTDNTNTNRFAPDTSQASDGIMRDVRLVDCGFFAAMTNIASTDSRGVNTTRFDMLECFSVQLVTLTLIPSSTSTFTSVRLRNITACRPQLGAGTFLFVDGAGSRYAAGCFEVVGCSMYTGANTPADLMLFINAEDMTRADFIAAVGEMDYNRFIKNSAHTPFWLRSLTDGNQTIATWQANSVFDDNSSVQSSTALNVVNEGSTLLSADLRLASDSGPLAGTGYPLPLGVSIDADGYLRSATTPDAGPYEYGASTLPDDPELSTGTIIRTGLRLGLRLGL